MKTRGYSDAYACDTFDVKQGGDVSEMYVHIVHSGKHIEAAMITITRPNKPMVFLDVILTGVNVRQLEDLLQEPVITSEPSYNAERDERTPSQD